MQTEIQLNTLQDFIDKMKSEGITKVAFTEINEKRAVEIAPGQLSVERYALLELLGYRNSVIFKFKSTSPDFNSVYDMLISENFEIVRRNRNIT